MCWQDLLPKFPSPSSKMPNTCAIFKWTVFNSMWTKWMTKKILCTCLLLFFLFAVDLIFFSFGWIGNRHKNLTLLYIDNYNLHSERLLLTPELSPYLTGACIDLKELMSRMCRGIPWFVTLSSERITAESCVTSQAKFYLLWLLKL